MKETILKLAPELLWKHFYEMSQIPRCSKDEERVRQYVIGVAERNGLPYKTDDVHNVVISKPASLGLENAPIVILQSHVDMVCEKNKDTVHDFTKDPIKLLLDGDWVKADGTTLGSDNGIGAAAALAVLEDPNIQHGPMEFLFTMDEETGLTGATYLGEDMLQGRILLNMDSEEDGAIYIGCAGGRDTEVFLTLETEKLPADYAVARVRIGGLQGGHSGLQIIEGLGNGIKLVGRFLNSVSEDLSLRLMHLDGGSKHNAIPRECDAIVALPKENLADLKAAADEYAVIFREELKIVDPGVFIQVDSSDFDKPDRMFSEAFQQNVLNLLSVMPHGVIGMSHTVEGLVETSSNFAVIKTSKDKISILTSQRSSVSSALDNAVQMVSAAGLLAGADVLQHNGYPGWQPNPESPLLKLSCDIHKDLFNVEPEVKAIHAGLECGIIGDKFPGMDMISFGPTILGAHSPDEKVQVSTVEKFWDFLVKIIEGTAK